MKSIVVLLFLVLNLLSDELMEMNIYKSQDIRGWLASEKLDGIRAYWDGKNLLSRKGRIISSPAEFTLDFPPFPLDGELFLKRGAFETTQSIVMDKFPNKLEWQKITYNIFDVPDADGGLLQRLKKIQDYLDKNYHLKNRIKVIKQVKILDKAHLEKMYTSIVNNRGEGLVLRDPNAPYIHGRSSLNLKYKPYSDSECEVVAHHEGKGRFAGMLGAISCKLPDGKIFKIGTGFSDIQRKNPPKIGEQITYRYQGFTSKGLPRFAVFLRIRKE